MTSAPQPVASTSEHAASHALGVEIVRRSLRPLGARVSDIVEQLPGGASTREFFRVRYDGQPAIAMFTPAPSQEIAKARQSGGYASFVEVAGLLRDHGVTVPRIYHACPDEPVLLVEDLGDDTLANYLLSHEPRREYLYQTAVAALAHAQNELAELPSTSVVRGRAFDHDLLRWEVDHFLEWALDARGIEVSAEDRSVFAKCAEYLATEIASWPRVFVHRDYQSRNLMVTGGAPGEQITWIDFQDAMMGPRVYDLVALLTDSYQTFSRSFIEQRLDEYASARGLDQQRDRIGLEFDLVTVQRKLKDAGRFIFLERVNGNSAFLQYVDATIDKARAALRRVHHLGPLGELEQALERILGPSRETAVDR